MFILLFDPNCKYRLKFETDGYIEIVINFRVSNVIGRWIQIG